VEEGAEEHHLLQHCGHGCHDGELSSVEFGGDSVRQASRRGREQ